MPLLPVPKHSQGMGGGIITGNRNRKKSWRTQGRPGAAFGLTPPLLAFLCGSGGLFHYQVHSNSGSSWLPPANKNPTTGDFQELCLPAHVDDYLFSAQRKKPEAPLCTAVEL